MKVTRSFLVLAAAFWTALGCALPVFAAPSLDDSRLPRSKEERSREASPSPSQVGLIGARLELDPAAGLAKVIDLIPNSPAAGSKLLPGDLITHVNGKRTDLMSLAEVVAAIRGEFNTPVHLTVKRPGEGLSQNIRDIWVNRGLLLPQGTLPVQVP